MPGGSHDSSFGIARGPVGTKSKVVDLKGNPSPGKRRKKDGKR